MKKKHNWTFKSKHVFAAMILVCISLMIFAAAVKFPVDAVRTAAGYIIVPFQKGINAVGTALDGATAGLQDKQKLVKEKKKLQEKVDELTAENSRLTQSISELERLQELYQLDQDYSQYDKVAANDDTSNVSAMTMSTSDRCIVAGDLRLIDEGKLQFIHLKDKDDKIQEGEKIVTSDVSEKFLPGILIGYVSEIKEDPNNLTKTGTLTPAVDFEHLSEVLVIKELKQQKGDS